MWNSNLRIFMVGIMMAAGVTLSACNGSKQEVASDTATEQAPMEGPADTSSEASTDLDGATVAGTPVNYDVTSWDSEQLKSISIKDIEEIKQAFGKIVATDENSLDYISNPATKYRFMDTDKPYLDLIDSKRYLELGWYYANPTDSDEEKELSQSHAQRSYKLAKQLMGNDGGEVLDQMLNGQVIKNRTIGGQKVELAKCEFYSCMLVLNKSGERKVEAS